MTSIPGGPSPHLESDEIIINHRPSSVIGWRRAASWPGLAAVLIVLFGPASVAAATLCFVVMLCPCFACHFACRNWALVNCTGRRPWSPCLVTVRPAALPPPPAPRPPPLAKAIAADGT